MDTRRARGWQVGLLWVLILSAVALATRRGTLVPWGTGEGPSVLGAPLWAFAPLGATLLLTAVLTFNWLRERTAS